MDGIDDGEQTCESPGPQIALDYEPQTTKAPILTSVEEWQILGDNKAVVPYKIKHTATVIHFFHDCAFQLFVKLPLKKGQQESEQWIRSRLDRPLEVDSVTAV